MFKKYLKIYLHFFKMNILRRMAYRFNFLLIGMLTILHMSISVFFIKIIYGNLTLIAGWDFFHALLIVASFILINALGWITCAFMSDLRKIINAGNLDGFISKPLDIQYLVSVSKIDPEDSMRILLALCVLTHSIINIGGVKFIDFILYMILIINAYIIFYSILIFVSSISFWTIENRGLFRLSDSIIQITQYPSDIYSGIMKTIFSFIIPIAFIATVPAKVLSGWWDWKMVAQSFLIAAIFFYLSRKFFLFGLRHYSSASS
ncbi:MAG: ABC-2 family transporter protein [bacterium]